jgi:hypothetical protein
MLWMPFLPELSSGAKDDFSAPHERARSAVAALRKLGIRGLRFGGQLSEVERQLGSDSSKQFEEGLRSLGWLLGFEAIRPEGQGGPDCIWRDGNTAWLIFEAKSEEQSTGELSVRTVRQASTHHRWVRQTFTWLEPAESLTVIVSPRKSIAKEAALIAGEEALVTPEAVRSIGARSVRVLREIRAKARGQTEEQLVTEIASRFAADGLDTHSLVAELGTRRIRDIAAD